MRAELPRDFGIGSHDILLDTDVSCEMLHFEMRCNNPTRNCVLDIAADGVARVIAVCKTCEDEMFMSGAELTAYWREQQRAWGVRGRYPTPPRSSAERSPESTR